MPCGLFIADKWVICQSLYRYNRLSVLVEPIVFGHNHSELPVCNLALFYVEESANLRTTKYGKPDWFDIVKTEYWGCREMVCLVDMSSFTKLEIRVCLLIMQYISPFLSHLSQSLCLSDVNAK